MRLTTEELLEKIEWEGGIDGVLEYGVNPEDVPEELQRSWKDLQDSFREFDTQRLLMEKRLYG